MGTIYEACQSPYNDVQYCQQDKLATIDSIVQMEHLKGGTVGLGENRKDNRQIKFRVNDDEFERLSQMAKEFQMSVPLFCKNKAQGARMRPPKIDREGAFEIARQLRAIGNNVNQLAKRANVGDNVPLNELQDIQKELHAIWQQFNSAIQK